MHLPHISGKAGAFLSMSLELQVQVGEVRMLGKDRKGVKKEKKWEGCNDCGQATGRGRFCSDGIHRIPPTICVVSHLLWSWTCA